MTANLAPQIMLPTMVPVGLAWQPQLQQMQQLQQLQQLQQHQQVQQLQQWQLFLQQQKQQIAAAASQQSKSTVATLTFAELIVAIASLYRDQLRPYGRILRKRIVELAVAGRGELALEVKELRALCSTFPHQLRVEKEGSDWVVLLSGQAQAFVDIYSPVDLYPENLWRDAAAYFCGISKSAQELPGGRYACAQILIQRRLAFLAGYSLGQVCHIVQLAINKKILGYSSGLLVPYGRSQSMVKDRRAQLQQASINSSSATPIATWDVLRRCVETLVEEVRAGGEPVALSSIKRTFPTSFGVELSETALGHAKVSELLQDLRVSGFCCVELRAHGYVLLPLADPPARVERQVARSPLILADCLKEEELSPQSLEGEQSALRKRAGLIKPLSMDEISTPKVSRAEDVREASDIVASVLPSRTPMTTLARTPPGLFPATPSPWSPWASATPIQTKRAGLIKPLSMDEIASQGASRAEEVRKASDIVASVLLSSTPMTTIARTPSGLFPATPSPWSPCVSATPIQTFPMLLGRTRLTNPRSVRGSGGKTMATPLGSLVLHTLMEECSLIAPPPEHSPMVGCSVPMFLLPPTPSTSGRMSVVQNTFIHVAELEPEPIGRGRCEMF